MKSITLAKTASDQLRKSRDNCVCVWCSGDTESEGVMWVRWQRGEVYRVPPMLTWALLADLTLDGLVEVEARLRRLVDASQQAVYPPILSQHLTCHPPLQRTANFCIYAVGEMTLALRGHGVLYAEIVAFAPFLKIRHWFLQGCSV